MVRLDVKVQASSNPPPPPKKKKKKKNQRVEGVYSTLAASGVHELGVQALKRPGSVTSVCVSAESQWKTLYLCGEVCTKFKVTIILT